MAKTQCRELLEASQEERGTLVTEIVGKLDDLATVGERTRSVDSFEMGM